MEVITVNRCDGITVYLPALQTKSHCELTDYTFGAPPGTTSSAPRPLSSHILKISSPCLKCHSDHTCDSPTTGGKSQPSFHGRLVLSRGRPRFGPRWSQNWARWRRRVRERRRIRKVTSQQQNYCKKKEKRFKSEETGLHGITRLWGALNAEMLCWFLPPPSYHEFNKS